MRLLLLLVARRGRGRPAGAPIGVQSERFGLRQRRHGANGQHRSIRIDGLTEQRTVTGVLHSAVLGDGSGGSVRRRLAGAGGASVAAALLPRAVSCCWGGVVGCCGLSEPAVRVILIIGTAKIAPLGTVELPLRIELARLRLMHDRQIVQQQQR